MIETICIQLVIILVMGLFMREVAMKARRALVEAKRSELRLNKALATLAAVNNANATSIAHCEAKVVELKNEVASIKMRGFAK